MQTESAEIKQRTTMATVNEIAEGLLEMFDGAIYSSAEESE